MSSNGGYDSADEPEQAPYSNSVPNKTQQQLGLAGAPSHHVVAYPPYYTDDQRSNTNAGYSHNSDAHFNAQGTRGSFPETEQQCANSPAQPNLQSYQWSGMSSQLETARYGSEQGGHGQPEEGYQPTTPHEHHARYGNLSPSFTSRDWSFAGQAPQTDGRRSSQLAYYNSPMLHSYPAEADFPGSSQHGAVDVFVDHPPHYAEGDNRRYFSQEPMEQFEEWPEDLLDIDLDLPMASPALVAPNNEPTFQQTREDPWSVVYNRRDLQYSSELDSQIVDQVSILGVSDSSDAGGLVSSDAITPDLSTGPSSFFQDVQNSMEDSQLTAIPNDTWGQSDSMQGYHQPSPPYGRRGVPDLVVQRNTPEVGERDVPEYDGPSPTP
jgi:hypothetical protein